MADPFDPRELIHKLQAIETKFLHKISAVLPLVDDGTITADAAWELVSQASDERAVEWNKLDHDNPAQFSASQPTALN